MLYMPCSYICLCHLASIKEFWPGIHRGISLDILSYYLVFLDISILNIFTYFSILFSFLFLKSCEYFDQWEGEQEMLRLFRNKKENSIEK